MPLSYKDRIEAVCATLLSLLDLWSPRAVQTMDLLERLPVADRTRGRTQLRRMADAGQITVMRGCGKLWWASAIQPVQCRRCGAPATTADWVQLESNHAWPWVVEQEVCDDHRTTTGGGR